MQSKNPLIYSSTAEDCPIMSHLIRNRSLVNRRSLEVKVMPFLEILLTDNKEHEFHFKSLVNHILANGCSQNKCHDLGKELTDINNYVLSLKDLEPLNKQLDRLLVGFNWLTAEEEVLDIFIQLLYTLIDLKPFKLEPIIKDVIIDKFKGFKDFFDKSDIQSKELLVFDKIHCLFKRLKIANLGTKLLSAFKMRFPMISGSNACVHSMVCYVYNGLKICDYIADKYPFIEFTFEKLKEYDLVLISFKTNAVNDSKNFDINKIEHILDNVMITIFAAIEDIFKEKSEEEINDKFEIFQRLFRGVMLSPNGFTHLSYVWFLLCSKSNRLLDQLIRHLWEYGLNDDNDLLKRGNALNFIGFILKNANFVSVDQVIAFMNLASNWIHSYIDKYDRIPEELTQNDSIFFIICQNLFDIFCSIHSDLDNLKLRRIKVMNFQRIIKCKLNPLEFCCHDIERQFLNLARHYQIGYCSQNEEEDQNRLDSPLKPMCYLSSIKNKVESLCKHLMDEQNSSVIEKINLFNNNSDESDYMSGPHLGSKRNRLLSDSSLNELIDY